MQLMTSSPEKSPNTDPESSSRSFPVRVDRKVGADLVTDLFFPVSPRTLEAWPLNWRHVNGKAVCETAELLALAKAKLDAAPPIRGGRKQKIAA